jgi:prevent-host-death family protein
MKFATVRTLKNQTSAMLREAAKGRDVLITSHGKPVALLHGLSEDDLLDLTFSQNAELRKSIESAWQHYLKSGGIPAQEMLKRIKGRKGKRGGRLQA